MCENGTLEELNDKSINIYNEHSKTICSAFPNYKTVSLSLCKKLFSSDLWYSVFFQDFLYLFLNILDGAIYNGYTYKDIRSQIFKLNTSDPEKNLKTFATGSTKHHIRSLLIC